MIDHKVIGQEEPWQMHQNRFASWKTLLWRERATCPRWRPLRKATERGIGSPSCGTRPTPTTAGPWRCATAPTGEIGYVSCECNEFVARLIDGGKSVEGRLTDKEQIGSWTRLVMEVVLND